MNAIPIGDGLTRFEITTADGSSKTVALDLIEATQQLNVIVADCKEKNLTNFEYLDRFAAWLSDATGVKINKGMAHRLAGKIDELLGGKAEPPAGEPGPS